MPSRERVPKARPSHQHPEDSDGQHRRRRCNDQPAGIDHQLLVEASCSDDDARQRGSSRQHLTGHRINNDAVAYGTQNERAIVASMGHRADMPCRVVPVQECPNLLRVQRTRFDGAGDEPRLE
jgi:hypothetical protein